MRVGLRLESGASVRLESGASVKSWLESWIESVSSVREDDLKIVAFE